MSRLLQNRRQDRMKEINLKNKEKERMKEREKEAREREARSSNGHLFTSLTVSSTTLCSSCNRSITAKEALSCPACNVTIHNRCRDSLASCAKMKQRQQKLSMVRNSSALQNVALRTKTPMMKERPSSAIYPSDSLRQSLLGSRRVRSGLSLAKSVSTNNIAGMSEDSVGLRRILSQSTESLNFRSRTLSMESLTDDGEWWWSPLLEELVEDGRCVQADSWSLVVEPKFLQTLHKDLIKQQDVIYELIQTEFHHVRTLRIMEGVFRRGMMEEVVLEAGVVHTIFPCLDQLLEWHSSFLSELLRRRKEGLVEGSSNFTVRQIGDLLLRQFSGQSADDMKKLYSEFCSRHPKAVKLYKESLNRDRRLQQFIRRACRGPLLRRHGVQECILLVTQRLTKYPVLIQRILDNTKGNEEEAKSLSRALVLLKELISSVDKEVLELDRTRRLQEIQARLDPRAQAEVQGGGVFRGGELMRRRLLHDGTLVWKVQGSRMKDVQVLLMSDILVFLQEKDQKFSFASLDKSPVVSLNNLIVRDIANQERGMYLISASTPPEMYELYASSKDDRRTWMSRIQQTANSCPSRDEFPLIETEDKFLLRRLRADIQQKDREVLELLQERVTLFSDLVEATGRGGADEEGTVELSSSSSKSSSSSCRNLFRADTPHAPQAEPLLTASITELDRLTALLLDSNINKTTVTNGNKTTVTNGNQELSNGDPAPLNGSFVVNGSSKDRNGNQLQEQTLNQKIRQRLVNLSTQLHAMQAAVIRQDSILELLVRKGPIPSSTPGSIPGPRLSRSMSRDTGLDASGEAVLLQRQVELLQEEVTRLRLRRDEPITEGAEPGGRKMSNGTIGDVSKGEKVSRRRGSRELELRPLAPLASQDPDDQLDGVQDGNTEEETEVMKISPRSDSPRDLQDIPEESECGVEPS